MLVEVNVMSRIIKIIFAILIGIAALICAVRILFVMQFLPTNEKFVESFDKQYMYTQLSSPKKTLCTVVILENRDSGKSVSFTLPYFNNRTIKKIVWGLKTNDLFVLSSDTGLTVYRRVDYIWKPFNIKVKKTT